MINPGNSALTDSVAQDFNKNLHEHFKVARKAGLRLDPDQEENTGIPYRDKFEGKTTVSLVKPHSPSAKNDATGGHVGYITHNPKTGEVISSAENNHGDRVYGEHSDPKGFKKAISAAKKDNWKEL